MVAELSKLAVLAVKSKSVAQVCHPDLQDVANTEQDFVKVSILCFVVGDTAVSCFMLQVCSFVIQNAANTSQTSLVKQQTQSRMMLFISRTILLNFFKFYAQGISNTPWAFAVRGLWHSPLLSSLAP
eukprot:gnl/MRDRNA2_/MRDRNA2_74308_c0_seq1.p1 gnl/MRDRNA2_/MRDRNA2_74308_c0~~gnl/MRDRNA2_/MRDRNA2_74308_c0_seq1.p1  ORF type:complete len:127 (+),score=10.43 gnl/MRDRNA2_/MRDRNA2_74308_c0_seq1:173-553(+)